MKKTLYLFLSLLLCFALFACTQEPETTPNEVEIIIPEVTPNEGETVTPDEVEVITPNEPEVVTPNEPEEIIPETPTEPEVPAEPEVPTEPDEEILIILESEEDVIYIDLGLPKNFPENFPEKPYTEPYLVTPEEFEWGDYIPIISYGIDRVPEIAYTIAIPQPAVLSREADDLSSAVKLYNERYKHIGEYLYGIKYKSDIEELKETLGLCFTIANYSDVYIDGIKYEKKTNNVDVVLEDTCNDDLLLIQVFSEYRLATYLYNVETKESSFLGNDLIVASLSPDGKYLAYCSPVGEEGDVQSAEVYTPEKEGFYVRNMENGETVFYSCNDNCCQALGYHIQHDIKAWIKK